MSSGSHLSKELHDLVKSIGETRSKQEEDKIILREQSKLKEKIKEKNLSLKRQRENLLKAIYIEMLGHDASFCYIDAVNMTQNKQLGMKRLGYLCCSLFLNETSEMLILLIANFQRDLSSSNVHEVVIALTALVNAVHEQVLKLLTHSTDLVRKKAVMVMQRIHQINATLIMDYEEKIRRALCDKEPSVMGAALNLYSESIAFNATPFKEHKLPREFDYHRMPAPWIQIRLLQILSHLGSNDLKVSEQIYEILGQALRRSDDTGINIGHAVTYQCVKTIASIYPNQHLLEMAASSISKFLTSENNNLKYLGINALISIVQVESKHVMEHQLTIVDCLESKDETLKRETLELLYKMTNSKNVMVIVEKLIGFLKSTHDSGFRKNLVNRICALSERFAPSQEWFLKTMNTVFEYGAEFVDNLLLNNFLKLLNENYTMEGPDFGRMIIEQYIVTIQKPNLADITTKMISWVIGEIGSSIYSSNTEKLNELSEVLLTAITNEFEDVSARSWILNALAKLSSCPSFELTDQVLACFEYYSRSSSLEVYMRSKDYINLQKYNAALRQSPLLVNFDENMSFLNQFVEQAKLKGAKSYDKSKSLKISMGQSGQDTGTLYFEPRVAERLVTQRPLNDKDEPTVKFKGENKWSSTGYKESEKQQVPVSAQSNEKKTSMSSNDYKKQQSMSSNNAVYRPDEKPSNVFDEPRNEPKPLKILEDPFKKEKEAEMNSLFVGVSNISTQKPTYSQYKQNIPQQTENISKPTEQSSKPQSDLLDLMGESNSQETKPQTQAPIKKQGGPPVFGKGPPVFGKKQLEPVPQILKQAFPPPPSQPRFQPYKITVEQYEQFWEQLSYEKNQVIQTKVMNESDAKNLLQNLGIGIIDIMDNELICAGKNQQKGHVMLQYAIYNQNGKKGQMEITLKSDSQEDQEFIMKFVQNN